MSRITALCAFLAAGLFLATHGFAGGHPKIADGDHHAIAIYYEEQAQLDKSKARDWEFAADYYEKFPDSYTGKRKVSEHVEELREIAQEFRQSAEQKNKLAEKHRSLMRKDFK